MLTQFELDFGYDPRLAMNMVNDPFKAPEQRSEAQEFLDSLNTKANEIVYLADGREVLRICVDALDAFEKTWPGATFPMARAGIVAAVLEAFKNFENSRKSQGI